MHFTLKQLKTLRKHQNNLRNRAVAWLQLLEALGMVALVSKTYPLTTSLLNLL